MSANPLPSSARSALREAAAPDFAATMAELREIVNVLLVPEPEDFATGVEELADYDLRENARSAFRRALTVKALDRLLSLAERGAEKYEADYRTLTGCSHALHESCANCTCGECAQRVVRAIAGGQVISLALDVAIAASSPTGGTTE